MEELRQLAILATTIKILKSRFARKDGLEATLRMKEDAVEVTVYDRLWLALADVQKIIDTCNDIVKDFDGISCDVLITSSESEFEITFMVREK